MVQTKKMPAGTQLPTGDNREDSLTTEVYHSKQPAHYDPETGDYDGQLPNPDLVDQLDPPTPAHLLPIPDNTVKSLFYWAMDLDITQGARMVLLTVIRHVKWVDGTGCTASIPTLAREAHQTKKTTIGHIKTLIDAGLISRKRRFSKATETLLATSTVSVETTPTVSVETTLSSQRSGNASNRSSSSTNLSNQSKTTPRLRKQQETKTPGTKETKVPLEEEKTTGTAPMAHAEAVDAWLETNMPASPMVSFAEGMLKHYYKHWWKPDVSDGWHTRTTVAEAAAHVTKDLTQWQKFRVDLRDKMLVGGLPPEAPDGTVQIEVYCESCHTMTAAYGSQKKMTRNEGTPFVDQCDVCLTPELVGV